MTYEDIKAVFEQRDYEKAREMATEYLSCCPWQYNVRFLRAKSNKMLDEYNREIQDLLYILKRTYSWKVLFELFLAYYVLGKYEEAYKLLDSLKKEPKIDQYEIVIFELVIRHYLGLPIVTYPSKYEAKNSYLRSQLYCYDEKHAIKHIKESRIFSLDDPRFNKDINIEELFYFLTQYLEKEDLIFLRKAYDNYYFYIPKIGNDSKGNICNYIKVSAIPFTNKILAMYPIVEPEYKYNQIVKQNVKTKEL